MTPHSRPYPKDVGHTSKAQASTSPPDRSPLNTKTSYHERSKPTPSSHIPLPPPAVAKSRRHPSPRSDPNIKIKRTWPPSPAVEDEKSSLAKEVDPPQVEDDSCSEVHSRGTIDQFPIILDAGDHWEDVEAQLPALDSSTVNVITSSQATGLQPLPPRGDKPSRRRPNISRINSDVSEVPYINPRQPSPYVFTPKLPDWAGTIYKDADLSVSNRSPSEALRGTGITRNRGDSSPRSRTGSQDGTTDGYESSSSLSTSRKSGRHSSTRNELQGTDHHHVISEALRKDDLPPRSFQPKGEAFERARRYSNQTSVRPQLEQSISYATPAKQMREAPLASSSGATPLSTTPRGCNELARKKSSPIPRKVFTAPLPSPPRSPRAVPSQCHDGSPRSGRSTAPNSRTTSRQGSPAMGGSAKQQDESIRRSSTFPHTHDERVNVPSRLAYSKSRPYDDLTTPHGHALAATVAVEVVRSLPYPVEGKGMMPSEHDHASKRSSLSSPFDSAMVARNISGPSTNYKPSHSHEPFHRPRMNSRQTFAGQYSEKSLPPVPKLSRALSTPASTMERVKISRVPCPRSEPVHGHNDWYGLEGCPNFDICPTCLDSTFRNGPFQKYLRPRPLRDPNQMTKCSFGTPWMRVAWLLTLEQRRKDLKLLQEVARLDDSEIPCSGLLDEVRSWYTILDRDGYAVKSFDVCLCDLRKIKALLPELGESFVRSDNTGRRRRCDLRSESARFREYLDLLVEIDAEAYENRKKPDFSNFIKFVEQKSKIPECKRDTHLRNEYWHFSQSLQEFTVCQDCYHSVIKPAKIEGSSVADRFNRTPVQLPQDHSRSRYRDNTSSASCQLYSPRMRAIFDHAVENNDFRYLAEKARERKAVEVELRQTQWEMSMTDDEIADTLERGGGRSDWRGQSRYTDLRMELERLKKEWRVLE